MGTFLESVFEKHIMPVQDTTSVLWTKNEIADWIGYSERTIEKIINLRGKPPHSWGGGIARAAKRPPGSRILSEQVLS